MTTVKYPEFDSIPCMEVFREYLNSFNNDHFCHLDSKVDQSFELWDESKPRTISCD